MPQTMSNTLFKHKRICVIGHFSQDTCQHVSLEYKTAFFLHSSLSDEWFALSTDTLLSVFKCV